MLIYNRVWNELVEYKFYLEYLAIHINKLEKQNKWIDNISILLSFGSIAGWYKFADKSMIWASILLIVNGMRLMKSKLMTPESEISTLKAVYEFYIDHFRNIEKLWFNIYNKKMNENDVEFALEKLRDEERLMTKMNKHNKIETNLSIEAKAREITDNFLKKYLS